MTWLRDSNTHCNAPEQDKSKLDQERVVMLPLRMTEKELDERISNIPNTQKKLACNSNFYFTGWDSAKALPAIKATVLELGLVEII